MASITNMLNSKGLIHPPSFLKDNVHYEVMMGSVAYGIADAGSDIDIYGFCIPPKEELFPHLRGEILGFGRQKQRFAQFQQHHVKHNDKEYDLAIFSIVKYFDLCMENNPNMIDSLFVPQRCVIQCSQIGNHVREHRKMFLHKGAWHKYKGYAFSQLHKMKIKNPEGKRKEMVEQHGYDLKFATHVVRLLNQVEQIMIEGDLDLERNREQLKSIRRGEWAKEEIETYFDEKERSLERLYTESKLQHSPDENRIKQLLLECLEMHYGNLDKCIVNQDKVMQALRDINAIIERVRL